MNVTPAQREITSEQLVIAIKAATRLAIDVCARRKKNRREVSAAFAP